MSSQLVNLLIGIAIATGAAVITALAVRKRTTAETSHLDADAADLLSQAAARLIPFYDGQLKAMEVRLTKAEANTELALSREANCLNRLNQMQVQIDDLRRQLNIVADPT